MLRMLTLLLALAAALSAATGAADSRVEPPAQGPPSAEQDDRININEADVDELVRLPGIGPARAEALVAERKKRRFRRPEDIMRVPGIGRKTYARLRDAIRVR
jgi:competence ComEA-like helix-hairpin-helix protein